MQKTLAMILAAMALCSCQKISPFISELMAKDRMDVDGDGIPRPDDCDDRNPNIGINTFFRDVDGDGFGGNEKVIVCEKSEGLTEKSGDCDDGNSKIFPFAEEVCDHLDNNCNGKTDDNTSDQKTWNEDGDQDGYGSMTVSVVACFAPENFVVDHTDCHDDLKQVHPGAAEICNEIDDNCNGQTDEGVQITSYQDADHDGYGNLLKKKIVCVLAPEDVTNSTDCDDALASVHPNALEDCDKLDNNCNGQTDEGVQIAFYQDTDGDTFGNVLTKKMACLPGPQEVTNATDCDDVHASVYPNASEICDGFDNDCNGQTDEGVQTTYFADVDQDGYGNLLVTKMACNTPSGYGSNSTDCNDLDKLVHPNAIEICNNIDDNCDDQTDEGVLLTFYADADQDKYGNLSQEVTGCTAPNGYVTNSADCNDGNKNIHPNAVELCSNKTDDDCDGSTDNALEATLWCQDKDKDGYGNCAVSLYACTKPIGFVANNSDCNDANAFVHPNTIEICTDGIDNNCNDIIDIDAIQVLWYKDADNDTFGDPTVSKIACSPPSGFVENALDCSDTNASVYPGAQEVCNNGIDDNCDGSVNQCVFEETVTPNQASFIFSGTVAGERMGSMIATSTNKSVPDGIFFGGEFYSSPTASNVGRICLISTPINPLQSLDACDNSVAGEKANERVGSSSFATGENLTDTFSSGMIIGSAFSSLCGAEWGSASLFLNPLLKNDMTKNAYATFCPSGSKNQTGKSVALLDIGGSSFTDVCVGSTNFNNTGAVHIFFGPIGPGKHALETADVILLGEKSGDGAGIVARAIGDINKDGKEDLAVSAWQASSGALTNAGKVYIFYGPILPGTYSLSTANVILMGESSGDSAGLPVERISDINADGNDDFAVSAIQGKNALNVSVGKVYIFYGPILPGTYSLSTANVILMGESSGDSFGRSISRIGDYDNDGKIDLLVGAPNALGKEPTSGAAYLFHGPVQSWKNVPILWSTKFLGSKSSDGFGFATAGLGDIDKDGFTDFAISALLEDTVLPDVGKIYLFRGLGL